MFGVIGGLLVAYLVWLIVRGPQALQLGVTNGWVGTAFRLAAGVVCLVFGLRQRRGSYIPLVFGVALIFTAIGNTVLTLDSLHGPPPPPPTPADYFLLGFMALCFAGIGLMAHEDRQRLSPRELLDGGIAALGAGAVGAAFALAHIARIPGESSVGAAFQLADAIGFVILVLLVAGAAAVAAGQSRLPWVALTAAFALLAVGSGLGAALGMTDAVRTLTELQWPAATLLVAAAMWADPGVADPLAVRRGVAVWIPALACGAAIAVLFTATLTRIDHTATALAAAALLLVIVRGYSELRLEIGARERTEKSLRVSETGYRRVADEQAALRRVATLVAQAVPANEVCEAVAREVGLQSDADLTRLERFEDDRTVTMLAAWSRPGHAQLAVGVTLPLEGDSIAARVYDTGRPARVDFRGASGPIAHEAQALGIHSAAGCPIVVGGRTWGAIAAFRTRKATFPANTEARIADFTELVATAISNAEARDELIASRTRLVTANDDARRRVVRDLHDAAQQRLVHAIITLKLARRAQDYQHAQALIADALAQAEQANTELRELAHGIIPNALARGGLAAGIEELASRAPEHVSVDVTRERFAREVEAGVYFVVAEALTNVTKHARAKTASVTVEVDHGVLRVEVSDDGVGGARRDGSGVLGLRDRVEALGGQLQIASPPGRGTHVIATLPLRADSAHADGISSSGAPLAGGRSPAGVASTSTIGRSS
ncbi:MAG TPA: ATP-binding protein [Solirubrobacteraceae bacterium]|nr:ATP-binding protein [Solirubrobacteraceae bacterium]